MLPLTDVSSTIPIILDCKAAWYSKEQLGHVAMEGARSFFQVKRTPSYIHGSFPMHWLLNGFRRSWQKSHGLPNKADLSQTTLDDNLISQSVLCLLRISWDVRWPRKPAGGPLRRSGSRCSDSEERCIRAPNDNKTLRFLVSNRV